MSQQAPIAIVGIGCRLPGGVRGVEDLWQLLTRGVDTIAEIPRTRWDPNRYYDPDPSKPGKMYVRHAAMLEGPIDAFDPEAFGISPKEVEAMDPQQRLLLEIAAEALDDAGLAREAVRGSRTGVFIGAFNLDKFSHSMHVYNREIIGPHTATGATMTILSARLAYQFDLRGPCLSMDTACSSSLVAFHYACRSIASGDCDMAIVGGASLMLMPDYSIAMCKGKYLAPDGRSKAFSAAANGYGRGEGAGIVVLKPLSKATEDRDRIYAVVHGTGVNQDGRTEALPVPNEDSQRELIEHVLDRANLQPGAIQYVEAHGTGTPKGDPIECRALNDALSPGRRSEDVCLIGSIKTNIGHLESAAGIAGVIKTALALKNRIIPPSLYSSELNPAIPFDDYCVRVARQLSEFPSPDRPLYAGVNSFGYGGTNAHAILGEAPESPAAPAEPAGDDRFRPVFVPFSAASESVLRSVAGQYADLVDRGEVDDLRDLAANVAHHRSHLRYRIAVLANSLDELSGKLRGFAEGDRDSAIIEGKTITDARPRVVFVFTGMGPQWWGMGRELFQISDVYRETIERCDAYVREFGGWSLLEELGRDEESSRLTRTEFAQTANFSLQAALLHCGQKWGVNADAVVGHSIGEVGAAYAGGALSLEDALKVSLVRSRLQATKAGRGGMLAVGLSEREALEWCHRFPGRVDLGAVNSPRAVTLSGDEEALDLIAAELEKRGAFNKRLRVEIAYHSYQMDTLETQLRRDLADLNPRTPRIPIYSTVTGERVERMDAAYWWRNVREPVRFGPTIEKILDDGNRVFLEAGPHPVLATSIQECIAAKKVEAVSLHCLKRKESEVASMRAAFAGLYTHGVAIDWSMATGPVRQRLDLPFYPWQRERIWVESTNAMEDRLGSHSHPLLARRNDREDGSWLTEVNEQQIPYLGDHRLQGTIVFPGAAYVEAALGAHREIREESACTLEDVVFENPLVISGQEEPILRVTVEASERQWWIRSRPYGQKGEWIRHATGRFLEKPTHPMRESVDFESLRARCPHKVDLGELYGEFDRRGLDYGPRFRGIKEAYRSDGEVFTRIEAPAELSDRDGYAMHPALLDSAFQSLIASIPGREFEEALVVPSGIREVHFQAPFGSEIFCYGTVLIQKSGKVEGRLVLFDREGRVFCRMEGFTAQAIGKASSEEGASAQWTYAYRWQPTEPPRVALHRVSEEAYVLIGGEGGSRRDLAERLSSEGGTVFDLGEVPADRIGSTMESIESTNTTLVLLPVEPWKDDDDLATLTIEQSCLALTTLQAALSLSERGAARVLLMARTTVDEDGVPLPPVVQSGAWGLGRVFMNEHPEIECRQLLLDDASCADGPLLFQEVASKQKADESAWCAGRRWNHRLERAPLKELGEKPLRKAMSEHAVRMTSSKGISSIRYESFQPRSLGPRDLLLRTHTAGLNFKDLMKVMGVLDPSVIEGSYCGDTLGMECSGRIEAVGSEVSSFKVGDWVCCLAPYALASVVVVDELLATPLPENVEAMEESPCYLVFGTALWTLRNLARLSRGERVLIHSATGGVGLAAIQYAQHVGAEIFATAGSEEKRAFLRDMGIEHVMDSRSLRFAEEIERATDGEGVDVVLNALAGDALKKSWSLLRPYGRFVEIGKRDIADNAGLPMGKFDRNLSFFGFDLDRLSQEHPEQTNRLFEEVRQLFQEGVFRRLPTVVYDAEDSESAFNLMARAKQVGRIAVRFQDRSVDVHRARHAEGFVDPGRAYLVTGGLGGFGLAVADWLVVHGARHLVLIGRSGASRAEAKEAIERWKGRGVQVEVGALDVSDHSALERYWDSIREKVPSVAGIVHGAMVLDDGVFKDLDASCLEKVAAPKVGGAWNLHRLSKAMDLDFFVMFSSVSSLIGNPGQGSYVAANTFLDAFAHWRRAQGLCATTINWGVLLETGVVARDDELAQHLEFHGVGGFSNAQALRELEKVLGTHPVQAGIMDVRWERWGERHPRAARSERFRHLVHEGGTEARAENEILRALRALPTEGRLDSIEETIEEIVSKIVRVPRSKLASDTLLKNLGIDSLMAVELANTIQVQFEVTIPTMDLVKGPPLGDLSRMIHSRVETETSEVDGLLSRTNDMSEEELDALLSELMTEELPL